VVPKAADDANPDDVFNGAEEAPTAVKTIAFDGVNNPVPAGDND
jgi:hypothetical protein